MAQRATPQTQVNLWEREYETAVRHHRHWRISIITGSEGGGPGGGRFSWRPRIYSWVRVPVWAERILRVRRRGLHHRSDLPPAKLQPGMKRGPWATREILS